MTETYKNPDWFKNVTTEETNWNILWQEKLTKNGCPAISRNFQEYAWIKPRRDEPDVPAREKMASDLANFFGLPMSSTLLSKTDGKLISISKYSIAPNHEKWSRLKVKQSQFPQVIQEVEQYFEQNTDTTAAIWAFDTWIRNRDRTDRNIMVGFFPDKLESVYFYDFDMSLSFRGSEKEGNWKKLFIAKTPPHIASTVTLAQVLTFVEKIESTPKEQIDFFIDRIPTEFLPEKQKEMYKSALDYRKKQLRSLFKNEWQQ